MMKKQIRGWLSAMRHGAPSKKLKIIAVAGMDGSESTAVYLCEMLKKSGVKVGLITKHSVEIAGKSVSGSEKGNPAHDIGQLQSVLGLMKKARCQFVVLELPQVIPAHFFAGVKLSMIVIRRLIDTHQDQSSKLSQISAMRKLITQNNPMLVLNRDDESFAELQDSLNGEPTMTFGTHIKSDCVIKRVKLHPLGSDVNLVFDHQTNVDISGDFAGPQSVFNVAAAACAAYLFQIAVEDVQEAVMDKKRLSRNLEYLPIERPYSIILDSSTTPDGLAETLNSVKHFTQNRVIAVVSASSDQPAYYRPIVGEVVTKSSDRLIVTTGDYNETESSEQVCEEIMQGVVAAGGDAMSQVVEDRLGAIEKAMSIARRGDSVIVLGSLNRVYRVHGSEHVMWDDRAKILELLEG